MTELITDREFISTQMYSTDEALAVRLRTHKNYTQPQLDFITWVVERISWRGDETVLDIGCGDGAYVEPVCTRLTGGGRLLSADLSLGILRDVSAKAFAGQPRLFNADAMSIPLPDACCDVVLANHMMFHVPLQERALAEFRRVLRQGGRLLAATNALNSMKTFVTEIIAAAQALGYDWDIPLSPAIKRFALENGGAIIEPFFPSLKRDIVESCLVFPQATPAVDYVHSMRHFYIPQLPQGLAWEALVQQVARQIEAQVAEQGEYRVSKTTGVFVAVQE
jgi:SAM-dependent methyltransferase